MQKDPVFHRQVLAERIAGNLISADFTSGLFLTAPRRTGKSTFIREDLIPLLKSKHQVTVVYADLWEDLSKDPAQSIIEAIRAELEKFDGLILRAAKNVGLEKVQVGGLQVAMEKHGFAKGETIANALRKLALATKKPIVFVIDEAQHTQTSEAGKQSLFALKSARDAMNTNDGPGFRLLATGSNAEKLASLVHDKDQAFYLAALMPLPTLGKDYVQWKLDALSFSPKPSLATSLEVFKRCNHRPEIFKKILSELSLNLDLNSDTIDKAFLDLVMNNMAGMKNSFLQQVNSLQPLESAVLRTLANEGVHFAPFSKASHTIYQQLISESTSDTSIQIDNSAIQQAMEKLITQKFIWKSGRGTYTIEDPQHIDWLQESFVSDDPEQDDEAVKIDRQRG